MPKKPGKRIEQHIRFPEWMDRTIRALAQADGLSYAELVVAFCQDALAERGFKAGMGEAARADLLNEYLSREVKGEPLAKASGE